MAAFIWPAELPQSIRLGAQIVLADNAEHFETSSGPGKTRRRFTVGIEHVVAPLALTDAQMIVFTDFFEKTLQHGAKNFSWWHPITNDSVDMKFSPGGPPALELIRGGTTPLWAGTMRLDIVPAESTPSIQAYEPPVDAPQNAFDFGSVTDEWMFETDDTFGTLFSDPNGAGFSYAGWVKMALTTAPLLMPIFGSSDHVSNHAEDSSLFVGGVLNTETIRFHVSDSADGQPQNWSETDPFVLDDLLWHFIACVWDPIAVGSRRVRLYFDGVLVGAGGNHPGDLAETWARPFWIGQATEAVFAFLYYKGLQTHNTGWDGPLSDAEVWALWGGTDNPGVPPNLATRTGFKQPLVFWYHPDGYTPAQGAVVTDHSGSGNHAKDAGPEWPVGVAADVPPNP